MVFSYPLGIADKTRPETFDSIEEFIPWSGSFCWDYDYKVCQLLSGMNIYPNDHYRVSSMLGDGLVNAFYDTFRPCNTYRAEDGLRGLFKEFEELGGGTYDDFVRFIVDEALFSVLDRLSTTYNSQLFAKHGVPKGKPRREMKRRYNAIFHWVAENAVRTTLRPMYDAWVNEHRWNDWPLELEVQYVHRDPEL